MRLLLWGLAAAALFATEPGKRLQRKAVDKFKELKGKTCGGDAQECDGQDKGANAESVDVGANGKPSKKEDKKEDETAEADDEADDKTSEVEASGDEEEHGIDQNKAAELVEKLSAKPSAPEDELKSA